MQAFYRGSIRSGFVSHSDEDDPEVLARIRGQALRDADWLVAKVSHQLPLLCSSALPWMQRWCLCGARLHLCLCLPPWPRRRPALSPRAVQGPAAAAAA